MTHCCIGTQEVGVSKMMRPGDTAKSSSLTVDKHNWWTLNTHSVREPRVKGPYGNIVEDGTRYRLLR